MTMNVAIMIAAKAVVIWEKKMIVCILAIWPVFMNDVVAIMYIRQ